MASTPMTIGPWRPRAPEPTVDRGPQGLTLGPLLRRLRLSSAPDELAKETFARTRVAQAALAESEELRRSWPAHQPLISRLQKQHRHRFEHLPKADDQGDLSITPDREQERTEQRAILHAIVGAERDAVVTLRDDGEIGDEVLRRVERGLDLEELRLDSMA